MTISFELLGVLVIGTLSILFPSVWAPSPKLAFGTVWSYYGVGYLLIPLVLPILGMRYLWRRRAMVA